MKIILVIVLITQFINNEILCYEFNNIEERLQEFGYLYESHEVTTNDGYILTIFRMLPRNCQNSTTADVVLLGHGATSNGGTFINMDPGYGLGFLLADNCSDVYLLNFRGSYYSLGHVEYTEYDSEYWDFSFHEMGIYDLPASIALARSVSEVNQVTYIGHSEGTNNLLVLLSLKPTYNSIIKNSFLFAPVPYMCHSTNAGIKTLAPLEKSTQLITLLLSGDFNLIFSLTAAGDLIQTLGLTSLTSTIQNAVDYIINGNNKCQGELVGDVLYYTESRIGAKDFAHFTQLSANCNFKPYQPFLGFLPASYPLKNVKTPTYAFVGTNDDMTNPQDINLLKKAVPQLSVNYVTADHGGILACPQSKTSIYIPVINVIKNS